MYFGLYIHICSHSCWLLFTIVCESTQFSIQIDQFKVQCISGLSQDISCIHMVMLWYWVWQWVFANCSVQFYLIIIFVLNSPCTSTKLRHSLTGNVINVDILKVKTEMLAIFVYVLTSCMCPVLINVHMNFLLNFSSLRHE